jgi:ubiquinone/menaquinone biosynthesis C-methylase UbiE
VAVNERRPDPDSLRYARYWEPVLAAAARRLLDRVETSPTTCLDIGAGTGSLTFAAAGRWPGARVIGLDASIGMLSVARYRLAHDVDKPEPDRFTWLAGDALDLPLDDAAVDLAVSAFVLQVVHDRPRLLREAWRVLRPGGTVGFVTWLAAELSLAADDAYEEVLAAFGQEAAGAGCRSARPTDYETLEQARGELASAGFADVDVRPDELHHAWSLDGYLAFKEHFDDHERFGALDDPTRQRLRSAIRARWATLPDTAFEVRGPLVSAVARKPA